MGVYGSLQRAMGLYTASDNTVGTLVPRKGREERNDSSSGVRSRIASDSVRDMVRDKQEVMRWY